jgi:hypothetical protein
MLVPGRETVRPLLNAIAYLVVLLGFVACGDKHAVPHELAPRSSEDAIGDGMAEPDVPEEVILGEVALDDLHEERIFRGERDAPAVFVRVREGGVLDWKSGEQWREITLEDLGTILGGARDKYYLHQVRTKKSVLEPLPRDPNAGIFLSIEADPGVPWQHIQWIMTIAAEQKVRRLEMSEGTRRLLASVPIDAAIEYTEGYEPPRKVDVHAVLRGERAQVRYRCGDTEMTNLADVTDYLENANAEHGEGGGGALLGEIKADHKVPYAVVFDVMEAFVAAEFTSTGFYGTVIPPEAVRSARRLP